MLSRHLMLFKTVRGVDVTSISRNFSHKFNRKSLNNFLKNRVFKNDSIHRNLGSTKTTSSKAVPILIGTAIVGGVIGAYSYFSKSDTFDTTEDEGVSGEPPFVYEHLDEDLALLKEYGKIPYLLIGAGSASFAAYRAIRTEDPNAKILMIGEEAFHPYMRPPLSKEMWFDPNEKNADSLSFTQWDGRSRSLLYEPPEYYFPLKEVLERKNGGVAVIRGTKVIKIDPVSQTVYLNNGGEITYEKCLIATGSKPKNIPLFETADSSIKKHVSFFRTVHDFKKLDKICKKSDSIVIVGGGFLGSELACGISKRRGLNKFKVIQLFPETGNLGKHIPEYLSKWTTKKMTDDGVQVIPEVTIKTVTEEGKKLKLVLSNDEIITADHIAVAVGSDADTEIAKASGLEVDEKTGGFVVNTEMEARKNLWIAGDASCFYDIVLGRRRVEHHDHAVVSGGLAGKNMTGSGTPYWHQSMFWSDLGPDIGFEAVGIVDSSLPTVGIFIKDSNLSNSTSVETENTDSEVGKGNENVIKPIDNSSVLDVKPRAPDHKDNYDKGVIFYLRNDIIVGILTWNVFSKMAIARKILNEAKSFDDLTEVAKLFELNATED
ncbi:apoptosis-inducing factor 1, mitochondrial [Parasteatoda tepidariorum]|uniref:apoptosis-inducing factor 1, mitochondrial n=1 Tax=Parasteatoda tepidariorum TaxID=114398 RepID=UPI00077F8F2F|nr:apoptosis-inducing factor 1, mitochondrial [Parasteatoda tepidariorum]